MNPAFYCRDCAEPLADCQCKQGMDEHEMAQWKADLENDAKAESPMQEGAMFRRQEE